MGCPDARGYLCSSTRDERGSPARGSGGQHPADFVDHQLVFMLILARSQQIPGHHFVLRRFARPTGGTRQRWVNTSPLTRSSSSGLAPSSRRPWPSGRGEVEGVGFWAIKRAITRLGSAGWCRVRVSLRDNTTLASRPCANASSAALTEAWNSLAGGVLCTEMTRLASGPAQPSVTDDGSVGASFSPRL